MLPQVVRDTDARAAYGASGMDDEDESREDGSHNPERNFAKRVLGLIAAEELVDGVDPLGESS